MSSLNRCLSILGSITATALLTLATPTQAVTVVEYHHKGLDAYFITGRTNEQAALDASPDFRRTGMTFQATAAAAASPSISRICRFYISLVTPFTSSHFYGREGSECEGIRAQNVFGFTWESYDFAVPEPVGGVCPAGQTQLYRSFRAAANGKTPNHRYTTSQAACDATSAEGFVCEGRVFCGGGVTPVTPPVAGGALPRAYQGTFRGGQQDIEFTGTLTWTLQSVTNGEGSYKVSASSTNLTGPADCSDPGSVSIDAEAELLVLPTSGGASYGGLLRSVVVNVTCPGDPPAVVPFGYIWFTCQTEDNVPRNQTSGSIGRLLGSCNANDGASFGWDFTAIP
ncbi:MAG: hypothetical protein EAZ43_01970 [Betaproteobacteria bacterium]|nr:MAG: hypothetical protein EAZ43_01970 [Betaproteobacteria bacterium]